MKDHSLGGWEQLFYHYLRLNVAHEDDSHDLGHFYRVWKSAVYIDREEGLDADQLILLASAYFHDLVSVPKNHPDRHRASWLSAEKTIQVLKEHFPDFPPEKFEGIHHAIHAHSFSANIPPLTAEAKILQDADRLEALGAIGLARVFYTAGRLNQKMFSPEDPLALKRQPDDRTFALDHFSIKLLKLPSLMNTRTGRGLADVNAAYLTAYLKKIGAEIKGDYEKPL
ncbi:MAG TPA: phosphohydrolase [Puia sp.]|nr:phosphohydrolase [Puia sp.]